MILALVFLVPNVLMSQISSRETGSIKGIATDEEGNPLPGVIITATSPAF
jgi:hypothetical protein